MHDDSALPLRSPFDADCLARISNGALFLDVDGTLLELAPTPDAVSVPARLGPLLVDLHRHLDGALALVSGRTVDDVDRIFRPLRLPVAGLHGLEVRGPDGRTRRTPDVPAALDALRTPLAEFVRRHPGALLEDKRGALALHTRRVPDAQTEARALLARLLGPRPRNLVLQEGKAVLEVRLAGANKGTAIEGFLGHAPFAGRWPVFAGDDWTDEDGFRAVNHVGGCSILVGRRRPTLAQAELGDVPSMLRWLEDVRCHLDEGRHSA